MVILKKEQNRSCWKGVLANTTVCEKREKSFAKPFFYYFLHILLPLPIVSLAELEWNPLEWSVYTHLVGAVWVAYVTAKLIRVLGR